NPWADNDPTPAANAANALAIRRFMGSAPVTVNASASSSQDRPEALKIATTKNYRRIGAVD
ncbi:MAG: hypothetical protein SNJ82_04930, partial [Gemmataceae bacterium]